MFCTPKGKTCLWESQCSNFQRKINVTKKKYIDIKIGDKVGTRRMIMNFGTQLGREYLSASKLYLGTENMKAYPSAVFEENYILNVIFLSCFILFLPSLFRFLTISVDGLSVSKSVGETYRVVAGGNTFCAASISMCGWHDTQNTETSLSLLIFTLTTGMDNTQDAIEN